MNDEIKEILRKTDIDALTFGVVVNYITNLQQENERLKQANKILEENWLAYMKINQEAIEFIKSGKTFDNEDTRKIVNKIQNDLLNILQNGSDTSE